MPRGRPPAKKEPKAQEEPLEDLGRDKVAKSPPTLDEAFEVLREALLYSLRDDSVAESDLIRAKNLYWTMPATAWQEVVRHLEGVVGEKIISL